MAMLSVALFLFGCEPGNALTPPERLEAAGPEATKLLDAVRDSEAERYHARTLTLADSLVTRFPDLPEGHYRRGLVLLKLYQLEASDEAFRNASDLDPYHRGAWYQRGHVSFEQGEYREAIERYRRQQAVIIESPEKLKAFYRKTDKTALPQTWLQIGRAYQLLYVADSSQMAYETVLELDSTHAQAGAWLSELYDEQGELDQALSLVDGALRADPRNPEIAYKVGVLLVKTGKMADAVPLLEYSESMQPWSAGVHYNLGRALISLGRVDEGNRHLEKTNMLQELDQQIDQARAGAARFPNDAERWQEVAMLLGRAGRSEEQNETLAIVRAIVEREEYK